MRCKRPTPTPTPTPNTNTNHEIPTTKYQPRNTNHETGNTHPGLPLGFEILERRTVEVDERLLDHRLLLPVPFLHVHHVGKRRPGGRPVLHRLPEVTAKEEGRKGKGGVRGMQFKQHSSARRCQDFTE